MANSSTQDLIIDDAELTCPITIKRGKTSRVYQVIAYPTQLTRKTTNVCLDGTATPDAKAIKKCRWHTAGIIRFHVNPETNLIFEARPDLHELEITLECLLEDSHKEQLAKRAEDMYGVEFSAENFLICPFQTFMAQLTIRISSGTKTFYGTLVDNKELHPMRVIFNIEDVNELTEIISKLDQPRNHDIVLRYDYSLGGTTTARASLTISAEDVNKIDLEKQVFGDSKAEHMIVSRSLMDKITTSITTKLRVVEDIGVGGSSFGQDLIKEEVAKAMSSSGYQKFSLDDIKQMQNTDTDISEDLKADIINSVSASNANSDASSHHTIEQSSSADGSNVLHAKSDSQRNAGGQSSSSSESSSWNAKLSLGGLKTFLPVGDIGIEGGQSSSSSSSQASNFDNSNSSARTDHKILVNQSSNLNDQSASKSSSNSSDNAVQGQIRKVKNIDATIVHRSEISKGFTISLERWHHQLATTSIKGRLTTKTDIELPEEMQAKEEAERLKQIQKEEEEQIAKTKALRQECELTSQQIDDILHEIDSMDEDKLREMHAEFLQLCPDGKMTRDIFVKAFRNVFSSGKVNNYCRYAFNIFDKDNNGTLNFTEYVLAMNVHESDDLESSLALAFSIFDYDKSEHIDQKEILHMIISTSELLGKPCEMQNAKVLAKKILDTCDRKRDGKITEDEFINGCKNNKDFCRILLPNYEQIASALDPNYEGDLENGRKHGRGVYTWPDGRRYEGQWNDNLKDGHGIETLSNGERFEGEWKNDKKNGKGTYTWSDGRRYEGQWKDDIKEGHGIETLPNGERFEGEWKNDKKDGKGVYTWSNGCSFQGEWNDDKQSDKGVYVWSDGSKYEGQLVNGLKNGKGILTTENGDRYDGQWKDNLKNGKGIFTWSDGDKYEGQYTNDQRCGQGVFTYKSGNRYEGQYTDDKQHGQGVFTWKNGHRYSGQFNYGSRHGKGVYTWPNGDRYDGCYKDGDRHGQGILILANGERYEGNWKDDKKHGKGTLTLKNGNRFEGEWRNGTRDPNGYLYCPSGMRWNGHLDDNLLNTAR